MADTKEGREKKAQDADRRQRERAIAAELERGDESEPPVDPAELAGFELELGSLEFPATGAEVVTAVGDREIESVAGSYSIQELIPETDEETFESPAVVRVRIQRPRVATAMKRILEANETLPNSELSESQCDAYETTFQELEAIDADDEGIQTISDWVVGHIRAKQKLPGSRDVRRQAAKFCRANGYQIRDDEWLGI